MQSRQKPNLTRDWIDPFAVNIVQRLQRKGYETYLVGGCVRDLLAGQRPKDYDIVTMARPEQVRDEIDRAYIIGKRFRLVLVKRGQDQFEVATFRREPSPENDLNEDGLQISDNVFGTPEEDARRRDFTVNSFFYDPVKDELIDYCEGMKDIEDRVIRVIGDPKTRLTEDPIRILRALRLAHKLDFSIEPSLRQAMMEKAPLLTMSALPRRREEMLKILKLQDPSVTLHECHDLGILQHAFPGLDHLYTQKSGIDDFDAYLSRIKSEVPAGIGEPVYLFGIFLLAYVRATIHADPHQPIQISEADESRLAEFMKKELGIFNLEESIILRALELQPELTQVEDYKKRGARRKRGFLLNESMPLALLFAEVDHVISPSDLHFWKMEYATVAHELVTDERPRRRRRRDPRKSPQTPEEN